MTGVLALGTCVAGDRRAAPSEFLGTADRVGLLLCDADARLRLPGVPHTRHAAASGWRRRASALDSRWDRDRPMWRQRPCSRLLSAMVLVGRPVARCVALVAGPDVVEPGRGGGGAAFGAVVAGLLWYNYARFGKPSEFGLNYQLTGMYEGEGHSFSPRGLYPSTGMSITWRRRSGAVIFPSLKSSTSPSGPRATTASSLSTAFWSVFRWSGWRWPHPSG